MMDLLYRLGRAIVHCCDTGDDRLRGEVDRYMTTMSWRLIR